MLQQFISFISEKRLVEPDQRVLLALSGGIDSMVMAELFHRARFRVGIAHCNFQLRGAESDEDEAFVASVAAKYEVPFFSTRFCTGEFADLKNQSIQMAARELRYEWFDVICEEEGFDRIATAHHLDDQIETFFINLLRGTGIAGLHGIPVRNGRIIRPMLFTLRDEISRYAASNDILYREDSSNSSLTYTRNQIRHILLPALATVSPDYHRPITATIDRIRDTESMLHTVSEELRDKLIRRQQDQWIIRISDLLMLYPLSGWMHELLSPFGFNESTIRNVIEALGQESGKTFYSPGFRMVKDRTELIISSTAQGKDAAEDEEYVIETPEAEIWSPIHLVGKPMTYTGEVSISPEKTTATLDLSTLTFPLKLRRWRPGDRFHPFGMRGKKKLSDFFIDEKIPIPDKESGWLLCSGDDIVWVIGHRIDNRYRVTARTRELLVVRLLP